MDNHIAEAAVHEQLITWYQYTLSLTHYQLLSRVSLQFLDSNGLFYATLMQRIFLHSQDKHRTCCEDESNPKFRSITEQLFDLRKVPE
jgi:CRISPR/Cas system-associated endonuclease Cas1